MPDPIKNTGIPAASAPISNSSGEKESRISTEKSSSKETAATTPSEEAKTTLLAERSATQLKLTNDHIGDALMEFNRAIKNILSQKTPDASILQMIETRFPGAGRALSDLKTALDTNSVHRKGIATNQLVSVLSSGLTKIMDARREENANQLRSSTTRKDLTDFALESKAIKPHYDAFIKQITIISAGQTAATTPSEPSEDPKTTLLAERSATQLNLTNDQIGDALMEFNRAIKNILRQKTPHASILQMIETRFPTVAGALSDLQIAVNKDSDSWKDIATMQLRNVLRSALTDIMDARLKENANELPPGTTRKDLIDIALASPEIKPHYDEFIKQCTTINTSPKSFLDSLSNFLDKLAEFFKSPHA